MKKKRNGRDTHRETERAIYGVTENLFEDSESDSDSDSVDEMCALEIYGRFWPK